MLQTRFFVKLFLLLSVEVFTLQSFASSSSDSSKGFDWKSFLQLPERSVEETSLNNSVANLADSATSLVSTPSQHQPQTSARQQTNTQQKIEKEPNSWQDEHKRNTKKRKRDTQRKYSARVKSTLGYGSLLSARLGQARKAKKLGLPLNVEDAKLLQKENKRQAEYRNRKKQQQLSLQSSNLRKYRPSNF